MSRYMEVIYLGESGDGYKIGMGAEFKASAATSKAFESARCHDMGSSEQAEFLIDLHEFNGDILDTITVSVKGFTEITGEPVLSESEYMAIDRKYWKVACHQAENLI